MKSRKSTRSNSATYHARGYIPADELASGHAKAKTQAEEILEIFRSRPGVHMTPFDIETLTNYVYPITSIRRCITNLTNAGHLKKDMEQRKRGNFGATNATWLYDMRGAIETLFG